jgi:uncharacterized membrane protein
MTIDWAFWGFIACCVLTLGVIFFLIAMVVSSLPVIMGYMIADGRIAYLARLEHLKNKTSEIVETQEAESIDKLADVQSK